MQVTEIKIGGEAQPIFFGGLALTRIYQDFECTTFEDLVEKTVTQIDNMRKAGDIITPVAICAKIAYRGIEHGAMRSKKSNPFKSSDEVLAVVDNFLDLLPIVALYADGLSSFFVIDKTEQSEGEVEGATVTAPSLPLPD